MTTQLNDVAYISGLGIYTMKILKAKQQYCLAGQELSQHMFSILLHTNKTRTKSNSHDTVKIIYMNQAQRKVYVVVKKN